jgi:hypothetical protein
MSHRLLVALAVVVCGCSGESTPEPTCPARAAFRVVVRAADGPLPGKTAIKIEHGGTSQEEYRLDEPDAKGEVMFCKPTSVEDGSGPDVLEVACDLWTQAETRLTVTAPGYPSLARKLAVETQGRCIATSEVELALDKGDGSAGSSF